ncbi:glycosyl hydrolase family 61-domain-containing protein [Chaetomium fimeti]|uniref:lytic cellulose monooxygenase (C4-dehydrogenating) n=1 Tax=Chaetomium fimeti TaxID=1854472 RepID=A0AAE0H8Y0_9PEZI|nr:glycosyl hydrolase family 61-domain-containing protein [Chaetomium fimeti]
MARQLSLAAALLATRVAAHGYINTFTLDGVDYEGFSRWNPSPDPNAISWSFSTPDEGPELEITSPDFICRRDAEPSSNYGTIAAGGTAAMFWTSDDKVINPNGWAESHRGPVMTYIAPCNGDCASVDKTSLRWTKIAESGLVSGPSNTQGIWATDVLRENGGINEATIPSSIAPGKYVIRNEIIALHRAHINEPEFYMQCGNIEVTGDGTDDLSGSGVPASELYSTSDSQLFGFSVHDSNDSEWPIPGPPLYQGQSAQQSDESEQSDPSPSPSPSPRPQIGGRLCRGR